jgi:hypothetical protein
MNLRSPISISWLGGVFVAGLALAGACNRPPAVSEQAPRKQLAQAEATSLQAPFVLRLYGPPWPPAGATTLSLDAVLQVPPGLREPVPIVVEVTTPEGVELVNAAARQVVPVGATVRLPLSFKLSKPLHAPIGVRASLERGAAMRAVAERFYPEPSSPAPSGSDPAAAASAQLPGIPVATPKETVR